MDVKGYHRWDFKTNSPDQVLRIIRNTIEDIGYHIHRTPPEANVLLTPANPDFSAEVAGRKIVARYRPRYTVLGLVLAGASAGFFITFVPGKTSGLDVFVMIICVIFSVLSVLFLVASPKLFRLSLVGRIKKSTANIETPTSIEIVTVEIIGGRQALWRGPMKEPDSGKSIPREQQILRQNFAELQQKLEAALPSFINE